ncbi:unnamed protein product [Amaranthus hypochondriacus]
MVYNHILSLGLLFGVIIFAYLFSRLCWNGRIQPQLPVHTRTRAQAQTQDQARTQAQLPGVSKGLDQETIDAYPTVVIGEDGKMMVQLDDNTCPICLCDYYQNDVLMVLPECKHRFHRDCLIEWLKLNATCPVCRIHPPHHFSSSVS